MKDDVTLTQKGRGKDGSCQVCGAAALGCPLDDDCPATRVCDVHFLELPGVESWGDFQRKGK